MAEQTPSSRERVKEIVAGIEENIQELFQSEKYFDYLRTMSRFHTYSVNNTLLIHMQRPYAATPVAGFRKWQQLGRHVKKGEKGLTIIAPTPLKKKIEEMKLDPDTLTPVLDQDGNAVFEEKVVEIPLFRPVKVFSADQTEGKPLPSLSADLTGDVAQYEAFMEALRLTSPVPIEMKPLSQNVDGLFNHRTQSISLREGMSEVQTVCAAVHEIAHSILHNRERDRLTSVAGDVAQEAPRAKDKNTMEVEAESVSFAVCQYYGIDTSENSLGYIATWSEDRSLPELKASLETITKTVNSLITSIDKHFAEVCKQRGIDLAEQQEEPDTPEKYTTDFFDQLTKLHEDDLIPEPFSLDAREDLEAAFLSYLRVGDFSSFRYVLDDIQEKADLPTVTALRDRLEALSDRWDAALVCKIEPLFGSEIISERVALRTYKKQDDKLFSGEVVHTGTLAECQLILEQLDVGSLTLRDIRSPDFVPPVVPEKAAMRDTVLDVYPMPDATLSLKDLEQAGYFGGDLLPLSRFRAVALLAQDVTIYAVQAGEPPEMVFDREDFREKPESALFAVSREEWESSQDFRQSVLNRMEQQAEREKAFLDHSKDCFALYQLRHDESTRLLRYEPLDRVRQAGHEPLKSNYELVYTGELSGQGQEVLDDLWTRFNLNHPPDYQHPSMSVSDIIALKQGGVLSCLYVDSFGFSALPDFSQEKNYMKNVEMELEDDYNMLDGIINNGPRNPPDAPEKKSVLAQLRANQPTQEREKPTAQKSAERER